MAKQSEQTGEDVDSPDFLYHYTDPAGMLGILGSRSIWATDAQYLNDTQEVALAAERMSHLLHRSAAKLKEDSPESESNLEHAEQLKLAANAIRAVGTVQRGRRVGGQPLGGGGRRVFVSCFSNASDSLSQWRGYGAHGGGYAIGFDRQKMSRFRYSFSNVETDPLKILRLAQRSTSIDWDLDLLNVRSVKVSDRTMDPVKVRYGQEELERLCSDTVADITAPLSLSQGPAMTYLLAYLVGASKLGAVKDDAFRDEREWRIVVSEAARSPLMRFRPGGQLGLIPYVELRFPADAISKIVVGPGGDPLLRQHSLSQFLAESGLDNIEVVLSEVPYRA